MNSDWEIRYNGPTVPFVGNREFAAKLLKFWRQENDAYARLYSFNHMVPARDVTDEVLKEEHDLQA